MTGPLPSSLSHDAGHTTGWKDAPWQGTGPFPRMSWEEEEEQEDERREEDRVLSPALHASLSPARETPLYSTVLNRS